MNPGEPTRTPSAFGAALLPPLRCRPRLSGGPVLAQLRARLADRLRVNGSPFLAPRALRHRPPAPPPRTRAFLQAARTTDSTDRIVVFFPSGAVVAKTCKAYADTMQTMEIRRGILVVSGKFSSFARSAIDELAPQIVLETFREEELRVDITEHELVPEHQVLSDGEKDALLKRYKLSETKLPRIQLTDPVARFYGMQRGEVVKIIQPRKVVAIRFNQQVIEERKIWIVLGMLSSWMVLVTASILTISFLEPKLELIDVLSISISLLGNTGPALGAFGPTATWAALSEPSMVIATMLMWLGRLELLTVLVLLHPRTWARSD